ncbi:VWA domain-containing protein [Pseudomonas sp. UL073]|uniref:VWA domain-containing protein n=1 Tax=Zestomonas insulae TaxID=2809017 RepID=A0ABS2ICA4_9GAMM|nr:VWA domain-containing protein [Pseudomonas insulae]MBM7059480.1 VWA domain-containing protein [Pseudomonas insulae]
MSPGLAPGVHAQTGGRQGRSRASGATPSRSIHWPRTLLRKANAALRLEHLCFRPRADQHGVLHCLLLDCSGSMLKQRNLALAKGLLLHWTAQLYRQRDELAVIAFAGDQARLLQAPRKAVAFNEVWISAIAGGGGTPLDAGLQLAEQLLGKVRRRSPGKRIGLWLLSDGRFSQLPPRPAHADFCVVVDFERAALPLGRAARLARLWDAEHVAAAELLGRS